MKVGIIGGGSWGATLANLLSDNGHETLIFDINETQVKGINDYLEAHEIVKVSLLKSCDAEVMEVALDLCSALKAELVQTVGRSIILYRPSKKKLINLKEA